VLKCSHYLPSSEARRSELRLQCLNYCSEVGMGLGDFNASPHDRTRPGEVTRIPWRATMRSHAVRVSVNRFEREQVCLRPPRHPNVFPIESALPGRWHFCVERRTPHRIRRPPRRTLRTVHIEAWRCLTPNVQIVLRWRRRCDRHGGVRQVLV